MLQELITSRVRVKLLVLFLTHPDAEYYLKGLVRELEENNNTIRRELKRLEKIGLLDSRRQGNLKYYRVNKRCPIYPELKGIVLKTAGVGQALRDDLAALGQIDQAFIYGSFAKSEETIGSDIDLMLVGEVDLDRLHQLLRELEQRLGREINETVYGAEDFAQRQGEGDPFLQRVMQGPKIWLIGGGNAVPRVRTQGVDSTPSDRT